MVRQVHRKSMTLILGHFISSLVLKHLFNILSRPQSFPHPEISFSSLNRSMKNRNIDNISACNMFSVKLLTLC